MSYFHDLRLRLSLYFSLKDLKHVINFILKLHDIDLDHIRSIVDEQYIIDVIIMS